MSKPSPFKWFKTSPEIIRLAVMMYVRFPLSLRNVEDLPHERGVEISRETVRFWWHRFGPTSAAEIRKRWIEGMTAAYPVDRTSRPTAPPLSTNGAASARPKGHLPCPI
jgi:putative transposase